MTTGKRTLRAAAIMALTLAALASCGRRRGGEPFCALPFPQVRIPSVYSDDGPRAMEFAAMHYWDALADTSRAFPTDTALLSGVKRQEVEAAFARYCSLLASLPFETALGAVDSFSERICIAGLSDRDSLSVAMTLASLAEKYLFDPNSPLRHEDLYGRFAERMSGSEMFPEWRRMAYGNDARLCSLNRTGTVAADFTFRETSGRTRTLHSIASEWTLVFFSNPGCKACKEIIESLSASRRVGEMITSGRLSVLNIYIDEDLAAWREYMPIYPESWINAYDPGYIIRGSLLYNIRAIPSLYLLDREKRVVMKDAVPEAVLNLLENLEQS